MTARDVIALALADHLEHDTSVADLYNVTAKTILTALAAVGYRTVGPGELDPETIERCIAANNKARERVIHSGQSDVINGIRAGHDRAEAALRALQSQEAGNEG